MPRVLYYAREESQLQKAWLGIPAGTGNARQTGRREQSGVTARRLTRARVRSQRRREQSRALLGFRLRLGFGLRKLTSGSSLKTSIVPLFPDPTHLNSFVTSATVKCVVRPMCECHLTIVSKRGAERFPLLTWEWCPTIVSRRGAERLSWNISAVVSNVEPNDRCELTRPCPVWEPSGRECFHGPTLIRLFESIVMEVFDVDVPHSNLNFVSRYSRLVV